MTFWLGGGGNFVAKHLCHLRRADPNVNNQSLARCRMQIAKLDPI